jgi:hypothetical protein
VTAKREVELGEAVDIEDDELWLDCGESLVDAARFKVVSLPAADCVESEL